MKATIYKEDEFGSRRTYELQGTMLRIEAHVFRNSSVFNIDLTDCTPDYTIRKGMLGAAFKRAITYLSIVFGVAFVVHDFVPAHGTWIVVIALIIAYPGLNVAIRSLRQVEVLEFRDSKGNLLFDFLRPRKQVPQINLDEFIAKIRSELIKARQPNQLPEPMSGLAPGHGSS
jgi:hypothetical protein